jgi:hypothetical protein
MIGEGRYSEALALFPRFTSVLQLNEMTPSLYKAFLTEVPHPLPNPNGP